MADPATEVMDEDSGSDTPTQADLDSWPERTARVGLAVMSVAALVLAALEDHEAVGVAFVGAAIVFGLGAAFFERLEELSTKGAKLRQRLQKVAEREAPEASPSEQEDLVEQGEAILDQQRASGKSVSPELAVREARLAAYERHLAGQANFANWLLERDWNIPIVERTAGADLYAVKDGRAIAVEIKAGRRPASASVVLQVQRYAEAANSLFDVRETGAVLALASGMRLSSAAALLAEKDGVSVYSIGDSHREVEHLAGPELT